ncbi:GDP-L-fucose synthase family protein [Candidatus Pelagibacter sp. Uisw_134_02]|uniref:GDP-L-fucose synthase family protein n=1 Tax=Candidatus Pelagibacter sp. Uisw_134_02 TaxID=3230990 RepID=UPI0039ECC74E
MINQKSKIYIAGHKGLVGSAILKKLREKGYRNLITEDKKKLNLLNQKKVLDFLKKKRPDFIFIAAAKVGGIYSNNKYKAQFIYENLMIQTNLIHSAFECGIKNLIFLGSSCIYPKLSKQPIKEMYLLDGKLEKTNDAYAVAKIAGIKMCESYNDQYKTNYKCLMPTNTFGPNDNYHPLNSHFIPSLIRKIHNIKLTNKKKLLLWGNGKAKREILFVDEIANACVHFMKIRTKHSLINIGSGKDYSIKKYAEIFLKVLLPNKRIKIEYDLSKPNGTRRKVLDISLARQYGWSPSVNFKKQILETYSSYLNQIEKK